MLILELVFLKIGNLEFKLFFLWYILFIRCIFILKCLWIKFIFFLKNILIYFGNKMFCNLNFFLFIRLLRNMTKKWIFVFKLFMLIWMFSFFFCLRKFIIYVENFLIFIFYLLLRSCWEILMFTNWGLLLFDWKLLC